MMNINLTYEDMTRPVEGPENVLGQLRGAGGGPGLGRSYNTLTGHVEQQAMSEVDFNSQRMSYNVLNYARDPSILGAGGSSFVGNSAAVAKHGGQSIAELRPQKSVTKATKRKRKDKGQLGVFDDPEDDEEKAEGEDGAPAAADKSDKMKGYMGPWAGWKDEMNAPAVPSQEEWELHERRINKKGPIIERSKKEVGFGEEKSVFHGKSRTLLSTEVLGLH